MNITHEPWFQTSRHPWIPSEMTSPPPLDSAVPAGAVQPRYALLINPFYPKDPNASFGKHVLTPTLALTSFAAATPEHWKVRYWDENLLDGRPPFEVIPEVVGITVHLTFAKRAFELARGTGFAEARSCWADCTYSPVPKTARRTRMRLPSVTEYASGREFSLMWKPGACDPNTLRGMKTTIGRTQRQGVRFSLERAS